MSAGSIRVTTVLLSYWGYNVTRAHILSHKLVFVFVTISSILEQLLYWFDLFLATLKNIWGNSISLLYAIWGEKNFLISMWASI